MTYNQILKVVAEEVDEINIAKIIIENTLHMDEKYDNKMDFIEDLNQIFEYKKRIKEDIKYEELLEICKKNRLKKYKHLSKIELKNKISNFVDRKIKIFGKKHNYKQYEKECIKFIREKLNYHEIKCFTRIERVKNVINILKFLLDNYYFLLYNKEFSQTLLKKINQFDYDIKEYPEEYKIFKEYSENLKKIIS